ncbi:type III secretion system export apparatus subunit SctU [Methyloraptor flagellatus]|jgi:type III secretion protein U|uniref:Type III secretion system export apparatus subunit SctU n=1 Tax=Methyloraptor flagellatus TaxID=3162530 RepID=A0AAU7X4P9_9HYPH
MSESGEKTEPPSPKKIRDARAKGQVAKSQEVVTAVTLLAVIIVVWVRFPEIVAAFLRMIDIVTMLSGGDFRENAIKAVILVSIEIAKTLLPVLGVTVVTAIAANYFQVGTIFALEGIMPSLDKISPASGMKKIFSMKQLIETLKSVLKIVVLSILLYFVVRDSIGAFVGSLECGMSCQGGVMVGVLRQILSYTALVFIVVAGADFMYQRHSYTKSLMMTKEEVKREFKESEGDPHIKGHRKQLAHELLMSDGAHQASKGSAVVVNPTHFAVVIRYDPETTPLPMVTAKGRNNHAHLLRTSAERAGVPVFRNVTLARALYATTEVDQFVPQDLFEAVAEILTWVNRNRDLLYKGPLGHGLIDMDEGDHMKGAAND